VFGHRGSLDVALMACRMKYFLSHRFDERDGTLTREARAIPITRKAAEVLRCLIARAGTIVPHEIILSSVWPDAHVQPDNIKVLVRELRRALGDDPQAPRYIRSEPGRGYVFVAPLCDAPAVGEDTPDSVAVHVNRHSELSMLASALAGAARSDCRVVAIEGERGMGKTALCEAFLQYASSLPAVRVCYGQCLQQAGSGDAYFPILDALQHLTRQSPAAIEPLLARHAPMWSASLRPWLSDGPAGTGPTVEPLRMFRELSGLLEALGAEATTVMVLDDMQWGDLATVDLLQSLARRRAPLRTLVVVTSSPFPPTAAGGALRGVTGELWPGARSSRLTLEPLGEHETREYLVSRFGDGPVAALARMLCRLTGGNPLALVSTLDSLVFSGVVWRDGAEWHVRQPMLTRAESLPRVVLDAVFWRFNLLGTESRLLLEHAAAVGPVFSAEDVAVAAGRDAPIWIERGLDALCARHLLERVNGGSPRGPLYGFLHPLHAELLAARSQLADRAVASSRLAAAMDRRVPRVS
jgi:DNA-binding winged helix-turn-helix (wHTH) protein